MNTKRHKLVMRNNLPWICEIVQEEISEEYPGTPAKCVVVKPEEIAWVERDGSTEKFNIAALWDILGNEGILDLLWDESTDSPQKRDGLVIIKL